MGGVGELCIQIMVCLCGWPEMCPLIVHGQSCGMASLCLLLACHVSHAEFPFGNRISLSKFIFAFLNVIMHSQAVPCGIVGILLKDEQKLLLKCYYFSYYLLHVLFTTIYCFIALKIGDKIDRRHV